jgi:hypothetical protein
VNRHPDHDPIIVTKGVAGIARRDNRRSHNSECCDRKPHHAKGLHVMFSLLRANAFA